MISAQTDPTLPTPSLSVLNQQELVRVINNGALSSRTHPQYQEVRSIMSDALAELTQRHHAENLADSLEANTPQTSALGAGITNFGQGATAGMIGPNAPPWIRQALGTTVDMAISPGLGASNLGATLAGGQPLPTMGSMIQEGIDPQYLAAARAQHPSASLGGEAGGAGALNVILNSILPGGGALARTGLGALTGGAQGVLQGSMEGLPSGGTSVDRAGGAIVGGIGGVVGGGLGAAGGQILARVFRGVSQVIGRLTGKGLATAAGKGAATAGTEISENAAQMIQRELEAGRPPQELLHPDALRAIQDFERGKISGEDLRTALDVANGHPPAPSVRMQSGGVSTQLPADRVSPIGGTQGRGFAVTGERATPSAPSTNESMEDIKNRLDAMRLRAAPGGTIPQPSGGVTVTTRTAADASASQPFAAQQARTDVINGLERRLGRSLTAQEREAVLTDQMQKLSKGNTLPFYSRGGQVSQAISPAPQTSPTGPIPEAVMNADATGLRRIIGDPKSSTALVNAAKQELASRMAALRQ